jgi:hypothetical protein
MGEELLFAFGILTLLLFLGFSIFWVIGVVMKFLEVKW